MTQRNPAHLTDLDIQMMRYGWTRQDLARAQSGIDAGAIGRSVPRKETSYVRNALGTALNALRMAASAGRMDRNRPSV